MTENAPRWGSHPLCTCTPITFGGPAPDVEACRRAAAPLDPHPTVNAAGVRALAAEYARTAR